MQGALYVSVAVAAVGAFFFLVTSWYIDDDDKRKMERTVQNNFPENPVKPIQESATGAVETVDDTITV